MSILLWYRMGSLVVLCVWWLWLLLRRWPLGISRCSPLTIRGDGTYGTSKMVSIRLVARSLDVWLGMSCSRRSWTHVVACMLRTVLRMRVSLLLPLRRGAIVGPLRLRSILRLLRCMGWERRRLRVAIA
jgi:hypothetical protein